ncbi:hypothetical protein [Shivajiella indica]|uniref:Type 1 periplasmic binding fold superfamily protein n=1 Tax=Shivajiella indica TaxID=872115 RepID=A0ABW5B6L2_9BACT
MKNFNIKPLLLLFAIVFVFSSCSSDDPVPENEEELITDVTLIFTELDENNNPIGTPLEFKASDSQGLELGSSPTIETIALNTGKKYLLEIELFNSVENEDITEEILEEADEHQFFFLGTAFISSPVLTYTYDDEDLNGNPVGLRGFVQVSPAPGFNNAQFRLILRHDLNKDFTGANNPNWENFVQAGGETDLDITFPLVLNP